jgi:hypothetical protein
VLGRDSNRCIIIHMELVPLFIGADDFTTSAAMIQLEENGIDTIPISTGRAFFKTGIKVRVFDYERALEIIKEQRLVDPKYFY